MEAKKKAEGIKEKMQNFFEEQNRKLSEMIGSNMFELDIEPKFTLKKLPLWGKTGGSPINFEWPTQAILDTMPADVRIQSLDFKIDSSYQNLASVKVTLSHNFSSQVFESKGIEFNYQKRLDFDAQNQIKRVKAAPNDGVWEYVYNVKLMNKQTSEFGICAPNYFVNLCHPGKEHQLADYEDLIGVYGVMDQQSYFSAFGFIVRVNEDN